jgi:hypothetical protein
MLSGPLHDRDPDGRCRECGEPFPCPTGLAIYEAVKCELESNVSGRVEPADEPELLERAQPFEADQPAAPVLYAPRWEDLDDRAARCPRRPHFWASRAKPTTAAR